VKHAGPAALDRLAPLIDELRRLPGLKEKSRGCFYHRSKGFLHFHEDPTGFFADLRIGDDFERFGVNSRAEIASLMRKVRAALPR
jgi:hypothetical protein